MYWTLKILHFCFPHWGCLQNKLSVKTSSCIGASESKVFWTLAEPILIKPVPRFSFHTSLLNCLNFQKVVLHKHVFTYIRMLGKWPEIDSDIIIFYIVGLVTESTFQLGYMIWQTCLNWLPHKWNFMYFFEAGSDLSVSPDPSTEYKCRK